MSINRDIEIAAPHPRENAVGPVRRSFPEPLADTVYRSLWDRILDRRVKPGEKLSDVKISQELGVSRTPVREALQRLVQEGVVQVESNRGFYVASFSAKDVEEIYDLRIALESMAVELAVQRLRSDSLDESIAELDRIDLALRHAESDDQRLAIADDFLNVDRAFHRLLVELASNSRLNLAIEGLWGQIAVFQRTGIRRGGTETAIRHHRRIIAALKTGDCAGSVLAIREHIFEMKQLIVGEIIRDQESRERRKRRSRTAVVNGGVVV